jgi:hypothetical protein
MRRLRRRHKDNKLVKWLAARKEAGLHIDPETAEVTGNYGQILDPYGVDPYLPAECQQGGWDYFARAPESHVWVWFGDLPDATRAILDAKDAGHRKQLEAQESARKEDRPETYFDDE